jgi:cytochrome c556
MPAKLFALLICLTLGAYTVGQADDEPAPVPTMSINDLMVTVITPATDTLWGIEDPQSDEDWQVFIDAANIVIEAARITKIGGTGPSDAEWAAQAEWQDFADRLLGAGVDARQAARNKDLEAMYTAGEVLYPPCEECHQQFHPGVREQQ